MEARMARFDAELLRSLQGARLRRSFATVANLSLELT